MHNDLKLKNKHVSLNFNNTCNMTTKLTLTIDDSIIRAAKTYARSTNKSLSNLVENYLKSIVTASDNKYVINLDVLKLKGRLKLSEDFDYKKELADSLSKKHNP